MRKFLVILAMVSLLPMVNATTAQAKVRCWYHTHD